MKSSAKEVKHMAKYSDDEIRNMSKITIKIASDYLEISPNMLTLGMRNDLLPIGFAVHNEDRYSDKYPVLATQEDMNRF